MAAKRRRRPKCGYNKKAPKPQKGRDTNGRIKSGYRITKSGRLAKRTR